MVSDSKTCRWVIDGFEAASFLDKCLAQILEKDFDVIPFACHSIMVIP